MTSTASCRCRSTRRSGSTSDASSAPSPTGPRPHSRRRDARLETAQIAIQASLTGHLVLSTLHTNDAPGAVTRLIDMGCEPFLVAATLEGVLGQRLLRRICPDCRRRLQALAGGPHRQLGINPSDLGGNQFYTGQGCEKCNDTDTAVARASSSSSTCRIRSATSSPSAPPPWC